MKRRGRLVTLSGIDCAGKTTQLSLLRAALGGDAETERSKRLSVLWFRPGYSRELDAMRRLIRKLKPSLLPTTASPELRNRMFERRGVRTSWLYLALLDTLLQYGIKLRVLQLFSDVVVCDRYLTDAALDLELRFPEKAGTTRLLVSLLKRACPSPDCAILLSLPEEEMLSRMLRKQEPFPDPPEIRKRRYVSYQALARTEKWMVLDATQPPEVVHQRILELLGRAEEGSSS